MWEEIKEVFNNILEKIYPSDIKCFLCGEEIKDNELGLCDKCAEQIEWNEKICLKCGSPCKTMANFCLHCQKHKRKFAFARAPLIYSGKVALAIQKFKYEGKKYLAKYFAKIMKLELDKMINNGISIDIITYVPLSKERQKERGYNQSLLLARELSKLTGIPISSGNLLRVRNTKTQTSLSFKERQANLDKAFTVLDKEEFKDKNILLIDDVLTTGSTADHCSDILKKAKVKNIYVLTFATTDGEK